MPLASDHQEWALIGAKARLAELDRERDRIFSAFPQLKQGTGRTRASVSESTARRGMSAEARRKASERMKAYWAKQGRKRRKLSPAARKKMSEGMRRHWAERRQRAAPAAQ